ncbi:MAG: DNA polymerase I [Deltaproteobacteria bacterium]|nr:DNA polymerase I [Deltaproteobacteria bacterium]
MSTVYLVDGSGYIYRAFYAIAPLTNSSGLPTNALYGFARMVLKLLSSIKGENKYIAVAFDTGQPTFRHKMYEDYKANRKESPDELIEQMPYFRKIVEALGICSLEEPGYEADDLIGTWTKKLEEQGANVIVVSGDKDLCQLVSDKVTMYDAMREINYDRDGVKQKFGVWPEQIIDYLSLIGDSSDNVPGIKGIGPKTAVQLLEAYPTLEELITNIDAVREIKGLRGARGVEDKLCENIGNIPLSKKLVTLDLDAPLGRYQGQIEELAWPGLDMAKSDVLFAELEFKKILDKHPLLVQAGSIAAEKVEQQNADYHLVDVSKLPAFIEELAKQKSFAFDTETTGLDVLTCKLVGISISWKDKESYYLPVAYSAEDAGIPLKIVLRELVPIFADSKIKKYAFNFKYDLGVMEEHGFTINNVYFDAMLAWSILNPENKVMGLKALTRKYFNEEMTTFSDLTEGYEDISQVPLEQAYRYACHDADATWRLSKVLVKELDKQLSMKKSFYDVEMPLVQVLSRMERCGIMVDVNVLNELHEDFSRDLKMLENRIIFLAGEEFNLNSPKQLSHILFEKLGLPTTGIKKTNNGYSTDASVLEKFSEKHEIAVLLLEYREIFKLLTTYVDSLTKLIHPQTGRIHTSFHQTGTATGRLSSSDPNLQNIPIKNARGRKIRAAFVARQGCSLIKADYSQIELRILAHLAGDENLIAAFVNDEDIHQRTAIELFHADQMPDDRQKEYRRYAKTINFGLIYGMGAFRLAHDLGISRTKAQEYMDNYFARYSRVKEYFNSLNDKINTDGYVETMFGRRRYLKDLDMANRDAGYAQRSLNNTPIQGTAADIIKIAMVNVEKSLAGENCQAKLLLQVHDELVFEVDDNHVDQAAAIIKNDMENAVKLSVPIKVDLQIAKSWMA